MLLTDKIILDRIAWLARYLDARSPAEDAHDLAAEQLLINYLNTAWARGIEAEPVEGGGWKYFDWMDLDE